MTKKVGLLVMAYGTPYKDEDIERYYTDIRHGHKPSEEMIADLRGRYHAIGGLSPLAKITEAQAYGLEKALNESQDEVEFKAYIGLKHIEPFIEDAVEAMHKDGIEEAISIVLAPHYSSFSVEAYNKRAKDAADKLGGLRIKAINDWYKQPKFIQMWADRINETAKQIPADELLDTVLIVSAHSLPEKIKQHNDPYPDQLQETADFIFEKVVVPHYALGWQSEGKTGEPWLGPDVQDLTRELYGREKYKHFIYTPVGFVAEHLEVLYDNDYECKVVTDEVGATYHRPPMPNSDPEFLEVLRTVVWEKYSN
ncbi:ferrochelatase [Listeria monocytogenes]|uniref:Coproporphyrin III ferrochelatase n=5 Tax=Listeria monocytogenes TaxID=1639 RepID=CPFC_LISMF|nr:MULTISPECIES: ferrochelatase [Listeria]Q71XF4.1 RecName: Full=Coproporphyrin III ferrochelatase [Listeria monocytogenes serotype 4b str. F2365]EAD5050916.1 ferrochelatase [Listeria monocytogenes serotype 4b]EAE3706597.1 ferrochelatase [Listeria monocytogenes serotype 1/2b]EAF4527652.1 ferrochelatase [Listeria monocytogenes serotype 1/2a]EAG6253047.1 ferrochelatase [Listeria monocytogenes CFSAN003806]EAG6262420.1 ferrochelatase [Listeria monocytogenes CFSAN003725]EAG6332406.1 ferrochelatas